MGEVPAHHPHRVGRGGRPARGPDGQQRGRPSQPGRGRDRQAGPAADRRGDRGRLVRRERDAARRLRRRTSPPPGARLGRRRARVDGPPQGADRAGRQSRGRRRGDPRLHRRSGHQPRLGRGLHRGGRGLGRGADRHGQRSLLRNGPRQARGANAARPRRAGRRARPSSRPTPARRRFARPTSRDETDEFIKPTLVGEEGQDPRRRQRDLLQLPPRSGAPAHRGARRRRKADHAHPVPGALGLSGGLSPGAAGRDAGLDPGRSRHRAAARGRDREVRPRDLLLQRRGGGRVRRARSTFWSTLRATCRPTTRSRR